MQKILQKKIISHLLKDDWLQTSFEYEEKAFIKLLCAQETKTKKELLFHLDLTQLFTQLGLETDEIN